MLIPRGLAAALALAALLGACARNPGPATPGPQAAPAPAQPSPAAAPVAPLPPPEPVAELSGEWRFVVGLGGESLTGTLTLARAGAGYGGSAQGDDGEFYPMNSLTQTGRKVVMLFETPSGPARVECTLEGTSELSGALLVGDQTGTFSARRK
jgi:hypothetical protein